MTQHQAEPFGRLTAQEANKRVAEGELTVVDVREPWEYARDHIPAATLTPLGQIIARPKEAITSDNVVFVCEVDPVELSAAVLFGLRRALSALGSNVLGM